MKKMLSFLLVILLFLFGCQKGCQDKKTVGILKFTSHPALDELEEGFTTRLNFLLGENSNFTIEKQNANKNPQLAKQLAEVLSRSDVSLILAVATPAAQALLRTESKIPVIYGAVADPKGAGLIPSTRFTGIQNASPQIISAAIEFIVNNFSGVKTVGTLYNPAEQNSVYVQNILKTICSDLNIKLIQRAVSDPSQVTNMTLDLINQGVNVIYSANDNTVNSAVASVVSLCKSNRIPFVIGDLSTLSKGALIAVGLEYSDMGNQLADMAYEILMKNKKISDFPPRDAPKPKVWLNKTIFDEIKVNINDSLHFYSSIDSTLYK